MPSANTIANIGISKVLLIKVILARGKKRKEKKLPDDGRMTETCRSVFKKF